MKKTSLSLLLVTSFILQGPGVVAQNAAAAYKAPSQKNLRIRGLMTYDNKKDVTNYGVYDYTVTTPISRKQQVSIPRISASGGSVVKGNMLYYYDYAVSYGYVSSAYYYKYDLATNQQVSRTSVGYDTDKAYNNAAMSVATDPTTGTVYCCNFQYDTDSKTLSYALTTWDLENMTKTVVGSLASPLRVLAASADGKLYGITASTASAGSENNGGVLVSVDKSTGAITTIGDTGVKPGAYFQSATIDVATGTFYWFANEQDEASNLYTVDLTTGKATLVGALPEGDQVVCAYVPNEYADSVPSPAENLSLAFDKGALAGTVSFYVPAEDYSGKTVEGEVSYTVTANGQTLAQGKANVGTNVSAPVTLAADGKYTFAVTLTNGQGVSPAVDAEKYVGYDTPNAVTDLTFTRNESVNTVTWTAPTAGVNGGYIDADALSYEVTRKPDGKLTTCNAASFSEEFDSEELAAYSYEVVAVNGTHKSASAVSNAINIGSALVPPYSEDFSSATALNLFTVIDANGDASTWKKGSGNVTYRYNAKNDADDWLITPPLKLQAGRSYTLSYKVWALSSRSEERLEVKFGKDATAQAMTTTLKDTTGYTVTSRTAITETVEVVPDEDGNFYIGFHAVSEKNKGTLYLDDITLSAGQSLNVPAQPADLAVTPADKGALSASVSFTAPSVSAAGKALTGTLTYRIIRDTTVLVSAAPATPGEAITYVDSNIAAAGNYTYTVLCANADGEGKSVEASAYVGTDIPQSPASVTVTDNGDGTAVVSWTASADKGINGGYVDPSAVQYDVTSHQGLTVAKDVTGTAATVTGIDVDGTQALAYFKVVAHNAVGKATTATVSDTILTGRPYDLPFEEGFTAKAYSTTLWTTTTLAGKSYNGPWSLREDADVESDGAYANFGGYQVGAKTRLQTPKLDVSALNEATLSFVSVMPTGNVKLSVEVSADYGKWQHLADVDSSATWTQHTYTIPGLQNAKTLRIGFVGECVKDINFIYLDNVKVAVATPTGIGQVVTDGTIRVESNTITVANGSNSPIGIFTITGQTVARGNGSLQATGLQQGVYVVRNGSTARTVIVK